MICFKLFLYVFACKIISEIKKNSYTFETCKDSGCQNFSSVSGVDAFSVLLVPCHHLGQQDEPSVTEGEGPTTASH